MFRSYWTASLSTLSVLLNRRLQLINIFGMKTNSFCRFGPQKIYKAVEKIMKWREIQIPASPVPDADFPLISPRTEPETSSESGSALYYRGMSEHSNEGRSSPGGSSSSTPRPSSKQTVAHVLIVDDNEINVKVLPHATSHFRVPLTQMLDHGHFHAQNKLQLRHSPQRSCRTGEIQILQLPLRFRPDGHLNAGYGRPGLNDQNPRIRTRK